MPYYYVLIRLALATAMAGVIGYERQHKNRPAGVKTHILVCLGSATFAILEQFIVEELSQGLIRSPELAGTFSFNVGRLVAQVISGIGFLGAGTIIITKHNIQGLTTAASIWVVACLGIVMGYGFYTLAIPLFITILITLIILNRFLHLDTVKKLEIKYRHRIETKDFVSYYFKERGIIIKGLEFHVEVTDAGNLYTEIYTVDTHNELPIPDIIDDLSRYANIVRIRCITV